VIKEEQYSSKNAENKNNALKSWMISGRKNGVSNAAMQSNCFLPLRNFYFMNIDLSGKNAMVCGSTQGIGKATALTLAEMGANVTLVARNEERLNAVMAELSCKEGQQHGTLCIDFNNTGDLKLYAGEYMEKIGTIHILVNNTGGPPGGPIENAKVEEFLQAFSNHLICNHILSVLVKEGMKKSGYGRIINVISTSVKIPLKDLGVSNTVRGAVANWSKTLANELGAFGITVNNVLPGATSTSRLASIIAAKAEKTGKSIAEIKKGMESAVPMQRSAEPQEIANAIAFLASPAASYINGVNLPVDGGRTGSL
jgi:3-oxoacyl-[acyl-carrier protein] reductase